MVVTAVVGQRRQQRLNTHQTQTVLVVDFHDVNDVNDVFVLWLFKRRDSVSFNIRSSNGEENLRIELFGPPSNLCSISRPCLREEMHNERDISCNCVEYDPLSHVQHVTGLNGHFTQWAHETNQTSDHLHLRELHSNYHLRLTRSRLLQGGGNRFFI